MKKGVGSTAFLLSCCRELGFPNKYCIALVTAQHTHIVLYSLAQMNQAKKPSKSSSVSATLRRYHSFKSFRFPMWLGPLKSHSTFK